MDTMEAIMVALGGASLLIFLWGALTYRKLVRLQEQLQDSWDQLDTVLQLRRALVPQLLEAVKGYVPYGSPVLPAVTEACTAGRLDLTGSVEGDVGERAAREQELSVALTGLLTLAGAQPALGESQHFTRLRTEAVSLAERIDTAKSSYNETAERLGARIYRFPSGLLARLLGMTQVEPFEPADPFLTGTFRAGAHRARGILRVLATDRSRR